MATTHRTRKVAKPISAKTRAEDERLREELRHADIEKFKKMVKPLFNPKDTAKKHGSGR